MISNDVKQKIINKEEQLNSLIDSLDKLERCLNTIENQISNHDDLLNYYTSEEWRKHKRLSEQKDFPSPTELPHGVLSQDGIFNAVTEYRELAIKMLKIGVKMLE